MVASNNTLKIGVIAEERNDVEVLYEITCKIIEENAFSFRQFVGHGCGKLRKKCNAWAANLLRRGCTHLVVVHDCDRNDEAELRRDLEFKIQEYVFDGTLILIPVEELEAWLLADALAIKKTFKMLKVPKIPNDTEKLESPKEFLEMVVQKHSKTRYLNTVHNKRIASNLRLTQLRKCRSYRPYPAFIKTYTK